MSNEVNELRDEIASLLEYAKTGRCADEECSDLAIHSKDGLELFHRIRDIRDSGMANEFLSDEVKRLDARHERFVKHCDALNTFLRSFIEKLRERYGTDVNTVLLRQIEDSGGTVQLAAVMNDKNDWYHFTRDEVLTNLAHAEISEGIAAYLLGVDRIQVRVLMEDKFGIYWRDIADADEQLHADEPLQYTNEDAAKAPLHVYEVGMGSDKRKVSAPTAAAAAMWYAVNCVETNNPFMAVCYTKDGQPFEGLKWWISVMPDVAHIKLVMSRVENQMAYCALVEEVKPDGT